MEALPRLREPINEICDAVNLTAAEQGKKDTMWTDMDRYPALDSLIMVCCVPTSSLGGDAELCPFQSIQVVESKLVDELKAIRKLIKKPALQYTTWNGEEVSSVCHHILHAQMNLSFASMW